MVAQGPMLRAVAAALRDADVSKQDGGARALARRYAALIDEAVPKATYAEHLRTLRNALDDEMVDNPAVERAMTKVEEALAAHSVMSDLGPKLLAVLTSLGMTAAGRGVKGGGGQSVSPVARKLDEFTERRTRKHGS
ncbi:hypothetical protein [Micromonospora sp. NPDC048839]|uniref:terminase small subunit n=1 Tax=Micromonospora sp. NPDC048839 TaxID=3155641 RepID=UPI0033CA936F